MKVPSIKPRQLLLTLTIVLCTLLFLGLLHYAWYWGYLRIFTRPFQKKESLQSYTADAEEIEIFFWNPDIGDFVITNADAMEEITAYLDGLTLIEEELTEEEDIYDPDALRFCVVLNDGTWISFEEPVHLLLIPPGVADCSGTYYYFYDSGYPISRHQEQVYAFLTDLLERYADADGVTEKEW